MERQLREVPEFFVTDDAKIDTALRLQRLFESAPR